MKKIMNNFNKFGDQFELLMRYNDICIYKRTCLITTHIVGYEVFIIKFAVKDVIINNVIIQNKGDEIYPNSEDFGTIAWFYSLLDLAINKYTSLIKE